MYLKLLSMPFSLCACGFRIFLEVGVLAVYRDGELLSRAAGVVPRSGRRTLLVGATRSGRAFRGRIQKIKVWDQAAFKSSH